MSTRNEIRPAGPRRGELPGHSAMGQVFSRARSANGPRFPVAPGAHGDDVAYLFGGAVALTLALALAPIDGLWGRPAAGALALYAVIAACVAFGLRGQSLRRFGVANGITLSRAAAVAFLAAIAARGGPFSDLLRGGAAALGGA